MQTFIRITILGIFAAAGTGMAVMFAVNSETPTDGDTKKNIDVVFRHEDSQPKSDSSPATGESRLIDKTPHFANPLYTDSNSQPSHSVTESREPIGPKSAPYQPAVTQQFDFKKLEKTLEEVKQSNQINSGLIGSVVQKIMQTDAENNAKQPAPPPEPPETTITQPKLTVQTSTQNPVQPAEPPKVSQEEGDETITLHCQNSDIREVLESIGKGGNLNILASQNVKGIVSASLTDVDIHTALEAILKSTGFLARPDEDFIYVGTLEDFQTMDNARKKIETRVYRPNYISAHELESIVTPLLTEQIGKATVSVGKVSSSSPPKQDIQADNSKTGGNDFAGTDVLVVRDYEAVLQEIDLLLAEIDRQPLQVTIEAMIINVKLDDRMNVGVNFDLLRNEDNSRLVAGKPLNNLANINVDEGGLKFGFLDSSVSVFVEALETIGDTNVVAAPRLMCLNKQRAEILIGSQLGYISTTVTENAATESVEFLEVGTQLRLRPFIGDDGMIRMEIHPELSSGNVRVEGGFTLPDKEVTQVTTNIMCHDGGTVIIGGLIREDLKTTSTQVPVLGSLPIVGVAFRQKIEDIERSEIIILLTPRIVESPGLYEEGRHAAKEWQLRQENYADKMSPIGKRHWGRQYLRKARAAWNAGDAHTALRYVNLAIHFDPMERESTTLRDQIMHVTPVGNRSIHWHLKEGLVPPHKPHRDYSKKRVPWGRQRDPHAGLPVYGKAYDQGHPGRSVTVSDDPTEEVIETPAPNEVEIPTDVLQVPANLDLSKNSPEKTNTQDQFERNANQPQIPRTARKPDSAAQGVKASAKLRISDSRSAEQPMKNILRDQSKTESAKLNKNDGVPKKSFSDSDAIENSPFSRTETKRAANVPGLKSSSEAESRD